MSIHDKLVSKLNDCIRQQPVALENLYPEEQGSRRSIYNKALTNGLISEEEYMRILESLR